MEAVARFRRAAPLRDAGWPIEVVCGITALAFVAEFFAALLLSERISALDAAPRDVSIAILAACGIGLSAFAGEAIHRGRIDRSYRTGRVLGVAAVGAVGLVIIAVEWARHLAAMYAAAPRSRGFELDGVTIGVVALVVLLAPGIAFAHRERWSTMTSRRRAWKLQRQLRAHERRRNDWYDELIALRPQRRTPPPESSAPKPTTRTPQGQPIT
ncbi:MAG TPA: hypothetical protein VIW69_13725 [Candidatus Elarobacter sp.]